MDGGSGWYHSAHLKKALIGEIQTLKIVSLKAERETFSEGRDAGDS
jgi:hypothetical protein